MIKTQTISWFSAGVSSAVATWLARDSIDKIIYCHIDDQERDTMRFVRDCEAWFGKPVEILQSPLKNVRNACMYRAYVNGPRGASCTRMLKRELRATWEADTMFFNRFRYIWGLDSTEQDRADSRVNEMHEHEHSFPLIAAGVDKQEAHGILAKAGIKRPRMYDLGYPNNNCVGCVKGGKGYWNKIRVDFPDVFADRAKMEREIGSTCLKQERPRPDEPASADNTVKLYLDELDPEAGRGCKMVLPECGQFCERAVDISSATREEE